jgi:hypothetical protein
MIKNLEYQVMHIDFNIYRVEQRSKINAYTLPFFHSKIVSHLTNKKYTQTTHKVMCLIIQGLVD